MVRWYVYDLYIRVIKVRESENGLGYECWMVIIFYRYKLVKFD